MLKLWDAYYTSVLRKSKIRNLESKIGSVVSSSSRLYLPHQRGLVGVVGQLAVQLKANSTLVRFHQSDTSATRN